ERELAGHNDGFVWLNPAFNHLQVANLSLPWFDRTQINGVVRFQYEHERSALADLDRLGRDQPRVLEGIENEPHPHKFRRPERVAWIRRYRSCFDRARTRLDGIIDKI